MRTRLWLSAWIAAAVAFTGVAVAQQAASDVVLTLSHAAPVLRNGEALLVTVEASHPLMALEGEAFGRPVTFWQAGSNRRWNGLTGIGLNVAAGAHNLDVRATSAGGISARGRMRLMVEARDFETRRLQVAERFVNPPEEQVARILREADLLRKVFVRSQAARLWRGPFTLPVTGAPTSSFGRLTIMNGERRSQHRGTDFRAAEGAKVRAPNAGQVVLAADLYFTGNTVVVDHGVELFSLFAHLSRMAVSDGMRVSGGDLLGEAGSTGRVTGPHLHWTVRMGAASVDPLSLVSALSGVDDSTGP